MSALKSGNCFRYDLCPTWLVWPFVPYSRISTQAWIKRMALAKIISVSRSNLGPSCKRDKCSKFVLMCGSLILQEENETFFDCECQVERVERQKPFFCFRFRGTYFGWAPLAPVTLFGRPQNTFLMMTNQDVFRDREKSSGWYRKAGREGGRWETNVRTEIFTNEKQEN